MQYQPWKRPSPAPPGLLTQSAETKKWIVIGFCSLWGSSADQCILDVLMAPNLNEAAQESQEFELDCEPHFFFFLIIIPSKEK